MKTKIKRHSRSVLSIVLTLCMLVSCMTVGIIATDAAKVTDSDKAIGAKADDEAIGAKADDEALGDTTYYMHIGVQSAFRTSSGIAFTYDSANSLYYASYSLVANSEYPMVICTTSGALGDGQKSSSNQSVTTKATSWNPDNIQFDYFSYNSNNYDGYDCFKLKTQTSQTVYFTFTTPSSGLVVRSSLPSGGGGGESGGGDEPSDLTTASKGGAPVRVLVGTDIMFYICSYNDSTGTVTLCNSSKVEPTSTASSEDDTTAGKTYYSTTKITNPDYYVQVTPSELSTKNRITNNLSGWAGNNNQSNNIKNASGGELFWDKGGRDNGNVSATSCTTEIAPASVIQGGTITFSTTCGKTTMSHGDQALYYQYYLDNETTPIAVASGKDSIAASTSAQDFVLSSSATSALSVGSHTLKTVATDGGVYYISDTDTFTVTAAEVTHAVTISASPSEGGTVSPSTGTEVGESTSTEITATPSAGYEFSSWTFGNGISGGTTSVNPTSITTGGFGSTYTVTANFSKKNLNVTVTPPASGGTISSDKSTAQIGDTVTVTATPAAGYSLSSISYSSTAGSGTASGTGNERTFTMPGADTTVTATFGKINYTVSKTVNPTGSGTVTVKKTNSSGANVNQYNIGDTLYLTASANAAYTFNNFTVTYGDGTSVTKANNSTINMMGQTGNITVQGNFTKKPTHKITVKTNNVAYGTALASVGEAYQGQSVTLTATENTGTFSKWVLTSGTVTGVNNDTNKSKTFTMGSTDLIITANFNAYSGTSNFYYNSYGSNGQPASSRYGARMTEAKINGQTYSYYHVQGRTETDQLFTVSYGDPAHNGTVYFVTPDGWTDKHGWDASTIDAQFYGSDGALIATWANMTADGNYGSDRCFKISIPKAARKVQFRAEKNDPDTSNWPATALYDLNDLAYHVDCIYISEYHKNDDGQFDHLGAKNRGNTNKPIADGFFENYNGTNKYTNAFSSGGFNNHNATRGASHSYTKPNGLNTDALKADYYVLVLYKNKTYTINGVTKTISNDPEIIWLPTLPSAVPDNTETVDIYAKNGTLRDSTFNRFTNLADTDFDTAYFEYTESLDSGVVTYNSIADYNNAHSKKITYDNAVSGYNSDYAIMKNVPIGAKIKIKTTLSGDSTKAGSFNNTAFKDTHYLKAYSFNGMSYQVNTPNSQGVYEEIWTVRDVNTKSADGSTNLTKAGKAVEVTPIYYMKDNTNCKTFYIDGYDGTVQNAWGNMLCVYPYYENKSNSANAFGGYPGQPMLFWGGKYQMEIPLTVDGTASGASVKGLTLHNSYWDLLHRELDIRCNARNHAQTYDYDDFYKLYKEKNPDTIIFDFKYRTQEDHYSDGYDYTNYTFAGSDAKGASDFTGSSKNGVELVTDYFGRQVDAFGTLIADANKSDYDATHPQDKELLFVSTGYKDTYVGEYATLWAVYAPQSDIPNTTNKAAEGETDVQDTAGKFIGYISSSMLYLNNWDRRLQYTGGDDSSNGRMSWSEFEKTYNWLKKYSTGVPALISYEKEIWNDSKDKAYRSDGKWYYSNKGDQIEANIIIQYNADIATSADIVASKDKALNDTAKWTTDAFSSTAGVGGYNNIGSTTECAAYFTNTSPNLLGKVNSGTQFADSTKNFTFRADAAGQYMFVNWVRYSNGKYYEITEKELAESVMSSNDTYIARFVKTSNGSLKVSHVVEQNGTYNGTGTPSVTVTVSTANDTQVFSQTSTDGTPIDISSYIQTKYSAYKIDISLTTTPSAETESFMKEIVSSSASYAPTTTAWNAGKTSESPTGADTGAQTTTVNQFTVQSILTDKITNLRYVSHLMKPVYHYNYEIVYTYNSRFWGQQSYTQTGICEDGDFTGSKTTAILNTDFIIGKTPYEKNFRQEINWNYDGMIKNPAVDIGNNTYKMTASVGSANTVNDKVTAEFVLPYKYNEKAQGYTVKDTDVYNSSGTKSGTSYLYDSGNESVTLSTKAYSLFTYDDENHTGSDDDLASSLPLMEAAPYLMKDDSSNPISYHYKPTNSKRYYTGNSFKVGNTTYYLRAKPDGSAAGTNEEIITDAAVRAGRYTVTFTKRSNMTQYGGDGHTTTYKYAVASGTPGTLDYKVYFFAYAMNANEQMVDNEGKVIDFETQDPVFNGQYIVYSESQEKDGVIEGTGVKKYFTRWDVYNTKGDFVASCYNRRFNYSGYDNYVIKPIYDSDTENNYASSLGTDIGSSITYLDDSRNQWKGTGASGSYASTTGQTDLYAADKIFADFAITYSYNGENINTVSPYNSTSGTGADIKIGMVIERLDQLDTVGSAKITSASYYADKYKTDTDWENLATALKNGTSLTSAVSGGHKCYNSKIGANVSGFGTQFGERAPGAVSGQTSVIDNFNRLQWFYTINNSTQRGENIAATVTEMKNYAYRAISYMIVTDSTGTKAYLCDAPTYFTIYDTATRVGY